VHVAGSLADPGVIMSIPVMVLISAGVTYDPCFAPLHRLHRAVPGQGVVTGCLTTGDSPVDCRHLEQVTELTEPSVNEKSFGYHGQRHKVGRLYCIRVRTIET
jgi:hypothetical protein